MPPSLESAYHSPLLGALGIYALVGVFGLYAFGLGAWILRRAGIARRGGWEGTLGLGLAAGLAGLGAAGFALAWAGRLTPGATWLLLAAGAVPSFLGLKAARSEQPSGEAPSPVPAAAWILGGLHLLLLLVFRAVPPTDVDGLAHQVALPYRYAEAGALVPTPDIPNSYLRSYATFLTSLAWSLGGGRFACAVNVLYFVALWLGICALGRKVGAAGGPAWTVGVWYAMPLVWVLTTIVGNDIAAACFGLAAFLLLEETGEEGDGARGRWAQALLGATLAFPAAVKLNAAFLSAPLLAVALGRLARATGRPARERARDVAVLLLGAVAPLLPFLALNRAETGNPFFPYATSLLGGAWPAPPSSELIYAGQKVGPPDLLSLPRVLWDIWMKGLHLGPLLPAALPLALAVGVGGGAARRAWIAGGVGILGLVGLTWTELFKGHRYFSVSRYLLPLMVVECLPLAVILSRATGRLRWARVAAAVALAGVAAWGAASVFYTARHAAPFLAGAASARDYVRSMSRDYDAVEYANAHLPREACVLSVTLHSLYMDRRHVVSNGAHHFFNFDDLRTVEDFLRRARDLGITHLLVPRVDGASLGDTSPTAEMGHYARFRGRHPAFPDSHADRLWSGQWADVYALRGQPR